MPKRKAAAKEQDSANISAEEYSRSSSVDRYSSARKKRGRRGGLKIFLAVLVAAFVATGGVALAYFSNINSNLTKGIDSALRGTLKETQAGDPFYMLLLGIDKNHDRVESSEYGANDSAYRTDTIILARIDPLGAKLTLVSIQRDTLVDLGDDYGRQKINASYTFGGAPLLIKTVSELAGVPISHYAEIDFDSFTSVVDAIGGITVNVPIDLDDDLAGLHISAGEQTIDGATALALCRARHAYDAYGAGDYYRTANQRMVLGAILKKALSGNPASLLATINAAGDSVSTTLSGFDILLLGIRFLGFDMSKDLMSGLEPTTSSYINGTWYELLDTTSWQAMMSRVDRGLSPYANASDDPTAKLAGNTGAISN